MEELITTQYLLALCGAFLIGISKSGIKGIGVINITIMALVFGAKSSTGIVLPLLIAGDIIAVLYYNKHCQWSVLLKLLPYVIIGVIIGALWGKTLPEDVFRKSMALIILISVIMMFMSEYLNKIDFSRYRIFGISMGILAGITTMIGNLAGAFANVFFLAMRLPKNEFIGTAAYLFFVVNLFKLPFHIISWQTITYESFLIDIQLIPSVLIGFVVGAKVVRMINEKIYRNFILVVTALGALLIFFR